MCIVALAWQVLPKTPLLLISNRDEFYARPTLPLTPVMVLLQGETSRRVALGWV